MKQLSAIKSLSALAHDGRLTLMRLLIQAGPDGLGAGDLATRAKIMASTASAQLLVLSNAGLVRSERQGRNIRYFAEYPHLQDILKFLMFDCCGNREEICCGLIPTQVPLKESQPA